MLLFLDEPSTLLLPELLGLNRVTTLVFAIGGSATITLILPLARTWTTTTSVLRRQRDFTTRQLTII